ncbi:MAG: hypothetical protein ACT4RN_13365 [Pseudonocardia sp.]
MRQAYAHDAVVVLDPGGEPGAPGGAITVALCGHWDHPPPCPLAPHHTATTLTGDAVRVRVLFAADPAVEPHVRGLIEQALRGGRATGPDGRRTTWTLRSSAPAAVGPGEAEHAARLTAG